jgi:hypothetical protein
MREATAHKLWRVSARILQLKRCSLLPGKKSSVDGVEDLWLKVSDI